MLIIILSLSLSLFLSLPLSLSLSLDRLNQDSHPGPNAQSETLGWALNRTIKKQTNKYTCDLNVHLGLYIKHKYLSKEIGPRSDGGNTVYPQRTL